VKLEGLKIKVLTPTVEDDYLANEAFMEAYDGAIKDDLKSELEMEEWMRERGLWGDEQDVKIEGIKKDIEKIKVQMYENRENKKLKEQARLYLRVGEDALYRMQAEKNEFYSKTCEGIASQAKSLKLFELCCYVGSERLDSDLIDMTSLFYNYNKILLSENQLRELARNDPWRMHWLMREQHPVFSNTGGRELSPDQRGITIWSKMYDNVQESMDCPSEDVINDDDLLDGWFIVQRQKQEAEKNKTELEGKINPKISNSDEILVVTNKDNVNKVHSMNTFHGDMVRKQRISTAKNKGKAVDLDFQDRKLDIIREQNQRFKEKSRR
jgi:hypothetical protein